MTLWRARHGVPSRNDPVIDAAAVETPPAVPSFRTTMYSPGVGTLVWSAWFDDLPTLGAERRETYSPILPISRATG